jgi:sugar lactone lactonase YvrE
MRPFVVLPSLAGTLAVLVLSGCSASFVPQSDPVSPGAVSLGTIEGKVYGGSSPIVGAHLYVFAAGTQASDGPQNPPISTTPASVSLLNHVTTGNYPTTQDSNGNYYITTGANGAFSVSSDYTCTPGQNVYLYSIGGNTGSGTNSAASEMAALGTCPSSGTLASLVPSVFMNEVTTVATAYALAPFASDATHVSDDEAVSGNTTASQAQKGLAAAFATVKQLVNIATGQAYATSPNSNTTQVACAQGEGTTMPVLNIAVPQKKINTLANILQACVNSTDASPANCTMLFNNTELTGIPLQPKVSYPSDTATAAIAMAQKPSLNVSTLAQLQSATPYYVPFVTVGTNSPSDLSLTLTYTGAALCHGPVGLAIDADGTVWMPNSSAANLVTPAGSYSITGIASNGTLVTTTSNGTYQNSNFSSPAALTIDPTGNLWVAGANGLAKVTLSNDVPSSVALNTSNLQNPNAVASDGSGNIWVTNQPSSGASYLTKYVGSTGTKYTASSDIGDPTAVAIDDQGYIWTIDSLYNSGLGFDGGADSVTVINSSGTVELNGKSGSSPAIYSASQMADDGRGYMWLAGGEDPSVVQATVANSPAGYSTYKSFSGAEISGIAFDGLENLWATNSAASSTGSGLYGVPSPNVNPGVDTVTSTLALGYAAPSYVAVDGSGNIWTLSTAGTLGETIGSAAPTVTPISAALASGKVAQLP